VDPQGGSALDHGLPDKPTHALTQENAVSDSYPWNHPADSADCAQRALQAVQVALDRRDNGGDAGASGDQVPWIR